MSLKIGGFSIALKAACRSSAYFWTANSVELFSTISFKTETMHFMLLLERLYAGVKMLSIL